jgi:3-methyladenine DNA glycosylase Tag
MRNFEEIFAIAADRRGGAAAVERLLGHPRPLAELNAIADDRWLAGMTRAVFNAGFNWKVIEAKWDGFEAAFEGFDINRNAMLNDDDLDRLTGDTRIVRNGAKIRSVQHNAQLLVELKAERGNGEHQLAAWPPQDFAGLLEMLGKRGSRLGGATAQYFLRNMGRDGFILGGDAVARLIEEGVIDKPPTSKAAMRAVQAAFNTWMAQSGRSLTEISRVLALSIGEVRYR